MNRIKRENNVEPRTLAPSDGAENEIEALRKKVRQLEEKSFPGTGATAKKLGLLCSEIETS